MSKLGNGQGRPHRLAQGGGGEGGGVIDPKPPTQMHFLPHFGYII